MNETQIRVENPSPASKKTLPIKLAFISDRNKFESDCAKLFPHAPRFSTACVVTPNFSSCTEIHRFKQVTVMFSILIKESNLIDSQKKP